MSESRAARPDSSFSVGFLSGLGGQALYLILAFPAGVLLARLLGPDGKGAVDLAILLPTLVGLFANLGFSTSGAYLVSSNRFPSPDVIANLAGTWLLLSALLTPIYCTLAALGWLSALAPGVGSGLLLAGTLLIPLTLGRDYLASVILGHQQFVLYNSVPVVYAATNLLGIGVLVWTLKLDRAGALGAVLASQFGCVLYLLAHLRRFWDGRPRLQASILREAASYGLKGQAGNILQFFNYRLDVLLLAQFRSLAEVGYYTLAVSLAELLWYIPNASALVVFPRTASAREEARQFTPLVFRIVSGITLTAAVVLAVVGRPLINLIYGTKFLQSGMPFLFLLPGVVCLGGAKVLSADLNGRGLPQYNALGALISLIVTLGLDLLLIPRAGANGAALASSAAYFSSLAYTVVVYGRISRTTAWTLARVRSSDLCALRDALTRFHRGAQ